VSIKEFYATLREQRWDDHRYYHHSRINQSLHLVSAISFLFSYLLCFIDPAKAALLAWCVAMTTRQAGHFFFEPKGYDEVNQATHEYKEEIKVGYNLHRKIVLLAIWAVSPAILLLSPTLFGWLPGGVAEAGWPRGIGLVWFVVGTGGLIFRTVHLCWLRDVQTGIVWMTKILSDPFHDIKLYYKAPFFLMRGQLIDPMEHASHRV
jgi:hypothetical protein